VVDAVFRLAGTASLGLNRYALLLKSSNDTGEKYLLLDVKQAIPSSLQHSVRMTQPVWANEAERAVVIQGMMQNHSPALLSTMVYQGVPYMVQEIQPTKDKINFKFVKGDYREMCRVISTMAILTASAQLRSTGRHGSDPADALIAFGRRKDWQPVVLSYTRDYALTVSKDYQDYRQAYQAMKHQRQSQTEEVT
jgi:uncharacterized protein (DUF2252 family)